MAFCFKSAGNGFYGARRIRLFLAVFALAAVVTALAAVFIPRVNSILHSSAGGLGARLEISLGEEDLFKDVSPDGEYAAEIAFLKRKGLAKGFEDGTYKPADPVKREEFIKLAVAAKGADPHPLSNGYCFKDVGSEWFARYVCYARNRGLVQGYEDGSFGTGTNITVSEALAIITRGFGADINVMDDAVNISTESELTRAQAAGLVVRALNAANAAR